MSAGWVLDSRCQFGRPAHAGNITPAVWRGRADWRNNNGSTGHGLPGRAARDAPGLARIAQPRGAACLTARQKNPSTLYDETGHRRPMPNGTTAAPTAPA